MSQTIYIAGAMRGLPNFNFDAFDEAEIKLKKAGWKTINPARMDRDEGFDPEKDRPDKTFLKLVLMRDASCIFRSDAIALLPDWEKSKGVQVEIALARWLGIPIYEYPKMKWMDIVPARKLILNSTQQYILHPLKED